MQVIENDKMIKLIADDGKRITNAERSIFVEVIYLPVTADKDKYEEVGREIWKYFVMEENPDIIEMQNQIKDLKEEAQALKEEAARLKNENILLTELLLENDYRISQELSLLKLSQK